MTTWHPASELPPIQIPELEILYWDGTYLCRIFGTYDVEYKDWFVGGEALIESDTPEWEVRWWAYPRLVPPAVDKGDEHVHTWEIDPHKVDWMICTGCNAGLPPSVDKGDENPLEDMPPLYREKECGERHRWEVIGTTATCIDCLTIQPKREGGVIGPQWVEE
jgi:hypothetical protein